MTTSRISGSIINHRQAVIDLLLAHGSLSRNDLARYTHFSKPTVSQIIAELIAEGVIRETGYGESTGGRKPIMLRLGGSGKLVMGVEIDATQCETVLVDLDGRILRREKMPVIHPGFEVVVDALAQTIRDLPEVTNTGRLMGVGVAVPGIVGVDGNTVSYAPGLGWEGIPIRSMLEARLNVPVMMTDRGKAAALGTQWLQARETQDNLLYIYLGSGVGGGIIVRNSLHMGATHTAGEVGHMSIMPDGPRCECGNQGCLETLVSRVAIEVRARTIVRTGQQSLLNVWTDYQPERITIEMIARAAVENDTLARVVLDETAQYLGIALANLVNVFNPHTIVLGGPVMNGWHDLMIERISFEVRKRALSIAAQSVQITFSKDEGQAVPLGAAVLVIQRASEFLAVPPIDRLGERA